MVRRQSHTLETRSPILRRPTTTACEDKVRFACNDKTELLTWLATLSKSQLVELIKNAKAERAKRYPHRKTLYGNVDRAFTETELRSFFHNIRDYRSRLCFALQAYAGLRINEAVSVKLEDIDWKNAELRVLSEKTGLIDFVPISKPLRELLDYYHRAFTKKIEKSGGWLVYSKRGKTHASADSLRNVFRKASKRAGLTRAYGIDTHGHTLYVLTTHSLRYYFASTLHAKGVSEVTIQKLMRHRDLSSTSRYINKTRNQLHAAVKQAFERR